MTLRPDDYSASMTYIRASTTDASAYVDDIDQPWQPTPANHRRIGCRRTSQGLPEAPPNRSGANEPEGREDMTPRTSREPKERFRSDRVLLWSR